MPGVQGRKHAYLQPCKSHPCLQISAEQMRVHFMPGANGGST